MKLIKKIFIFTIILAILAVSFIIYKGYKLYEKSITETSIEEKISKIKNDENFVELNNVSNDFKNAIISIEDHRFYKHHGFDIISFGRAMFSNIKEGNLGQGGSTISQ